MRALAMIKGMGLGAGLMYVLDPDRGRARRARMRDQAIHLMNEVGDAFEVTLRDAGNRARGLAAEAGSLLREGAVPDDVLVARARSKMGRYCSHPRAIEVEAHDGRVILSGPILAREVQDLVSAVSRVRGVHGVENRLDVYQEAGHISALQGGRPRPGERFELFQETWSPTAWLLVGMTGALVASRFTRRGGLMPVALGALGAGLIARQVAEEASRRGRAPGARYPSDREAGRSHSTIATGAPIHDVAMPIPPRAIGPSEML
jgi:hypothetical protein